MNQKTVSISKKTSVSITAVDDEINLDEPIWAINWFNLKNAKLYDFYNVLAFPHLRKAKGRVHFKGYIQEKAKGHEKFDRDMLLIVKYPSADAFLRMVSNKLFLLKSVVRIKSVSRFIFGFTKRIGENPTPPSKAARYVGKNQYMAHLFQSEASMTEELSILTPLFTQYDIVLYFQGVKAATISRKDHQGQEQTQPFFVDGLLLLEAPSAAAFDRLMEDATYQTFKSKCSENNIYHVKRVI